MTKKYVAICPKCEVFHPVKEATDEFLCECLELRPVKLVGENPLTEGLTPKTRCKIIEIVPRVT